MRFGLLFLLSCSGRDAALLHVSVPDEAVSVWSELVFEFDRPVDSDVIGGVVLEREHSIDCVSQPWSAMVGCRFLPNPTRSLVPAEVVVDGDRVTVRPWTPLERNRRYHWSIDDGEGWSGGSGEFATRVNPTVDEWHYDIETLELMSHRHLEHDEAGGTVLDRTTSSSVYEVTYSNDAEGKPVQSTETVDGVVVAHGHWTRSPLSETFANVVPGEDGVFDTADDRVDSGWIHLTDDAGRRIAQYGATGPWEGGSWPEVDALQTQWSFAFHYQGDSPFPLAACQVISPGADLWDITDDQESSCYEVELEGGAPIRFVQKGSGGDVLTWVDVSYDDQGRFRRADYFNDPGSDGQWFTDDDFRYTWRLHVWSDDGLAQVVISEGNALHEQVYDELGREVLRLEGVEKGADGEWATDDDIAARGFRSEYGEHGSLVRYVALEAPAPDGDWGSPNASIVGYDVWAYTEEGDRESRSLCFGAGADGRFLTDDDDCSTTAAYATGW